MAKAAHKAYGVKLDITGVRKAEGGIRSAGYKNCCTVKEGEADSYRQIFWYTNADRAAYEKLFDIHHSECCEAWGFARTGCAGCPYNRRAEQEREVMRRYEPNLYKALQCGV